MKIFLPLCLVSLVFMALTPGPSKCQIAYEGIYYSPIDSVTSAYLRFYKDGTVLHTTSIDKPTEVMKYLNLKNSKLVLKGDYSFGKCYVTCTVFGGTGKMKFAGAVKGDSLYLKANNSNDGTSTELTFGFIEEPIPSAKK